MSVYHLLQKEYENRLIKSVSSVLAEVKFKRCRDMCVTPRTADKDRSVDVDENASAFMLIFDHTS